MLGIIGLHCALLVRFGGRIGSARLFRYQHVGIANAKLWRFRVAVKYRLSMNHYGFPQRQEILENENSHEMYEKCIRKVMEFCGQS